MTWYLLQAKTHKDAIAEENLIRQHFKCYRPMCRKEKKVTGKLAVKEESLFPGYLFIQLSDYENWAPVRSTFGVKSIVRFGERPASVPDEMIEQIKFREKTHNDIHSLYKAGEKVWIKEGAFTGLEAIFECNSGDDRVFVLLTVLNQKQRINMPVSAIVIA